MSGFNPSSFTPIMYRNIIVDKLSNTPTESLRISLAMPFMHQISSWAMPFMHQISSSWFIILTCNQFEKTQVQFLKPFCSPPLVSSFSWIMLCHSSFLPSWIEIETEYQVRERKRRKKIEDPIGSWRSLFHFEETRLLMYNMFPLDLDYFNPFHTVPPHLYFDSAVLSLLSGSYFFNF